MVEGSKALKFAHQLAASPLLLQKLLAKAHARAKREGKSFSAWVSELLRAAKRRVG